MNKAIAVGIIVIIIIIIVGIVFSISGENNLNSDQILSSDIDLEENDSVQEEPTGRNLTVELNESLGLSSP